MNWVTPNRASMARSGAGMAATAALARADLSNTAGLASVTRRPRVSSSQPPAASTLRTQSASAPYGSEIR
jgi:hypothetical protein